MARFLTILLLLDAIVLAAAVLLQAGKGGGLAASFGGAGSSPNSLLGSREAGNLLTKTSWWSGGIFLGLAFILQLSASRTATPTSVLDPTGNAAKAPVGGPPATGAGQTAPLQPVTPVIPPGTDVMKKTPDTKQPDGKKTPPPAKPPTDNRP